MSCTACAAGQYFATYGSTFCKACPSGMFTSETNTTACRMCTVLCPGPNFYLLTQCNPSKDIACVQFQSELSHGSQIAMLFAPIFTSFVLCCFFLCKGCNLFIPPGLDELMVNAQWEELLTAAFSPDARKSFPAAIWSLLLAANDIISNIQLLILLHSDAPFFLYTVALTSMLVTIVVDVLLCTRLFSDLPNLIYLWMYVLECPELDPKWQEQDDPYRLRRKAPSQ